ncbi:MAG: acyltransferase family protein [Clostridia bacterium]|nr:acyltransferase family protein [Clostridia bacterium]
MEEKKRLDYIDYIKAIGIFLVVLGHCLPAYTILRTVIYSFHVPLFAFAGGLLSKTPKTARELGKSVLRLLMRLGIPYLIWYLVSCIPYMVKNCPFKTDYGFWELVKIFFLLGGRPNWNAALWFIPCYFIVSLLFLFTSYFAKGNKFIIFAVGCVSFLGIVKLEAVDKTVNLFGFTNIFSAHNVLLLFGFFAFGFCLSGAIRYIAERKEKPYKNYMLYIALGVFITSIIVSALVNRDPSRPGGYFGLSVLNLNYNNIFLYIPIALTIIVSLTLTCALLPRNHVIRMMSSSSFFIMSTHYFFFLSKFHTTPSWKAGKWEAALHLGMREGVFITVLFILVLLVLYAIRKRAKWFDKVLCFFGI